MTATIAAITIIRTAIPFTTGAEAFGIRPGLRPWDRMECLAVRVQTTEGLVGWGEAFGHNVNPGTQAILETLVAPWFLGRDPAPIAAVMDEAQRAFHIFGRTGPALYALSALDIALWDIAAKRANQPLYRLLGGNPAPLPKYASLMRYDADPTTLSTNVRRAEAAGYTWIKLHEATVPAFRTARGAVAPATRIMLDVNCPWSLDEARAIAREIADDDFHWLEEPIWPPEDFEALAQVRDEGVAVAAGENIGTLHDFQRLFEAQAVDIVQPSVAKVGGITAMQRILALAQAYSVRVVPHCFYWGPGYLATAALAATIPRPTPVETAFITLERQPHPAWDPLTPTFTLAETPGLGFDPDPAVMDAYTLSRTDLKA